MNRYQILIEYDGSKFIGWQSQVKGSSIQKIVQNVFTKLLKQNIKVLGAGRTDAGVHAFGQSAHFDTKKKINDLKKLLKSSNYFLNKKLISIISIKRKNLKFHARYSAKFRIYSYRIFNRDSSPSIYREKVWHVKKKININLLKKGANCLVGKNDYSTFRSSSCGSKSPIRTINFVKVKKIKDLIEIRFKSQSFLQQQVRSMVGCLKYLGEEKWDISNFKKIFLSKDRRLCAPPAPAHGLYLEKVIY